MKSKFIWLNKNATIRRLVNNDKVGRFVAETWANMFEKYVPADKVILATSYRTEPFKVTYYQPYSHYQWNGISRSGKKLNYSHEKHRKKKEMKLQKLFQILFAICEGG